MGFDGSGRGASEGFGFRVEGLGFRVQGLGFRALTTGKLAPPALPNRRIVLAALGAPKTT